MAKYTYTYKDSPNLEIGEIFANNDEEAIKIAKEARIYRVYALFYENKEVIDKKLIYEASVG